MTIMKELNMFSAETAAASLLYKFGLVKLLGFGAALLGAGMMAIFRPPKTRKEMILQAAVALGSSFLFGGSAVAAVDSWSDWINLTTAAPADGLQFIAMVHGLIGAMAWGMFGGMAVLRDKFGSDPIQAIKDVKDI